MTSFKRIPFISVLLLIGMLAAACTFPTTMSADFEVHMVRPWTGTVIMLGESLELGANGTSTAGDVLSVQFLANGSSVGATTNHYGGQVVASLIWTPSAAGEYQVQAAALRSHDTAYSAPVYVCVLPFQIAPGHTFDTDARGYEGDCTVPSRSPSAVSGTPSLTATASPATLTYIPDYFDLCASETRIVSFEVDVDDPHDDVVFVPIALVISPAYGSELNSEATLVLTHTSDIPPHTKVFTGQIDMHIFLARSLEDHTIADAGVSGDLNWTARAFGRDGAILLEHGPITIPVIPIHCDGSPLLVSTSIPFVIESTSTATPSSAKDCPPGTYFADVTHKCIAIEIPPTPKPGSGDNGGGSSCSGYGNPSACTSNGCSWDKKSNSCS